LNDVVVLNVVAHAVVHVVVVENDVTQFVVHVVSHVVVQVVVVLNDVA